MEREKLLPGYYRLNSDDHYATIKRRKRVWEFDVRKNDGTRVDNGEICSTLNYAFEAAGNAIERLER